METPCISFKTVESVLLKVRESKSVRKYRKLTNVHLQEDGGEEGDDPDQTLNTGDPPVLPHLNNLRLIKMS
jgi:hypothetical protein